MKAKEIEAVALQISSNNVEAIDVTARWLQEIAYQLAVLNEREQEHDTGDGCLAVKMFER